MTATSTAPVIAAIASTSCDTSDTSEAGADGCCGSHLIFGGAFSNCTCFSLFLSLLSLSLSLAINLKIHVQSCAYIRKQCRFAYIYI